MKEGVTLWKIDSGSKTGTTTASYTNALDWMVSELAQKTILLKNTHASASLKYKLTGYTGLGGTQNRPFEEDRIWHTPSKKMEVLVRNYLNIADKQRIRALLELGWNCWRIQRETGVRRETIARYATRGDPKTAKVPAGPVAAPAALASGIAKSSRQR